jgi:hypothetical protein
MHAHEHMKAGKNNANLTTKYDGSPAVVFGTHPKNKKFFVASKSAFNKDPKINHTHADIDKNHGHAPGLATKLKAALDHLPKVTPKGKVYQGDIMHSSGDVHHDKKSGKASFTPNTITYTAHGDEAKKAAKAKVGVAVHTQYHGKDIQSMSAHHEVNHHEFKQHPDVHHHDASYDTSSANHSQSNQDEFHKHMNAAKAVHDEHGSKMYSAVHASHSGDSGHLATYINSTVRTNSTPNVGESPDKKPAIAIIPKAAKNVIRRPFISDKIPKAKLPINCPIKTIETIEASCTDDKFHSIAAQ